MSVRSDGSSSPPSPAVDAPPSDASVPDLDLPAAVSPHADGGEAVSSTRGRGADTRLVLDFY